ncbi:MAG: HAMP domain-containing protein [Burkholderiaceae bacterium]|nr:HAMP domain-containing protein [Burkholderiaceae bacterium]
MNSIRSRLMAICLGICLLFAGGLGVYAWFTHAALKHIRASYEDDLEAASQLAKARDGIWALRWGFAQYIALGDANAEGRAKVVDADPRQHKAVTEALDAYGRGNLQEGERKNLVELQAAYKQYYDARAPWFKLMAEVKKDEAAELRARTTTPYGAATVKALLAQFEAQKNAGAQGLADAGQAESRLLALLGTMLVVLLLPLGLVWWLTGRLVAPIRAAEACARAVAAGELGAPVPDGGNDEAGRVLAALRDMQQSLLKVVGQVRSASDSIQTASAEIATGNTDLSQRTEQTASNLQQTAGSIEQLTGSVRQSADAAAQANQLAANASAVAQRGGQVVSQVVSTMDEINHSSKRIADIIGTIDGIAFQTNILALNAAVEAARAGEQGRGFAVVASEVRSLAQRSAEAAREIKTLIGASVDKVETGARLVQDAGSTMGEIVASVQRVTDIIGEISAATAEQSGGIGAVNAAVAKLDQMTQQNAALVEESTAAAESLRDQAGRLAGVVGHFDLGNLGHGGARQATATATATVAVTATAATPRPAAPRVATPAAHEPVPQRAAAPGSKAPAPALETAAAGGDWESF